MSAILRPLVRNVLRALTALRLLSPVAMLFARAIDEVPGRGATSDRTITLLALNPGRFRGDLEVLAQTGKFRVLRLPFVWQAMLIPVFYGRPVPRFQRRDVAERPDVAAARDAYRRFLRQVLAHLRRRYDIDVVIGAAVHYAQDRDWGAAANGIGVPYVVFHREGMISSRRWAQDLVRHYSELVPFEGDLLIAQTEVSRDVFVDSRFVDPDSVAVAGVLRMDGYIEKIRQHTGPQADRPLITLFSFHHSVGLAPNVRADERRFHAMWSRDGVSGYVRLFDEVHAAVARFAFDHPDVEVIIKPKWAGEWPGRVREAIERAGMSPDMAANLRIEPDADAQELILRSHVVCGFGSTTLLEAAIAGRPVVVPMFAEAMSDEYDGYVPFGDDLELFDVAHSPAELGELLEKRLHDSEVAPDVMAARRRAFERYVSSVSGRATDTYVRILEDVADASNRGRQAALRGSPQQAPAGDGPAPV